MFSDRLYKRVYFQTVIFHRIGSHRGEKHGSGCQILSLFCSRLIRIYGLCYFNGTTRTHHHRDREIKYEDSIAQSTLGSNIYTMN